MRKSLIRMCLLALCLVCVSVPARAELVYTGASGFTLTLPAGWFAIIGGDEDEFEFVVEELEPGDEEALFSSADGAMWVTVLYAGDAPVNPHALDALLGEAAMEARVGEVSGYQKMHYQYDEANRRAFILYSLVDTDEGTPYVEYLVGFVTGSDIAQFLIITVRADQLDARFNLISEIVNGIDVGGVREGAEG